MIGALNQKQYVKAQKQLRLAETAYRTTEKERTDADMAIDAMASLAPLHLLQILESHIAGRPDIPAADLEAFTNRLRRRAWAIDRGEI